MTEPLGFLRRLSQEQVIPVVTEPLSSDPHIRSYQLEDGPYVIPKAYEALSTKIKDLDAGTYRIASGEPSPEDVLTQDSDIINIDAHSDTWGNILSGLRNAVPKIAAAMKETNDDDLLDVYIRLNERFNSLVNKFENKQDVKIGWIRKALLLDLLLKTRDIIPKSAHAEWDMLEQILK